MSRKHRGNDLLSSFFATRGGYNEEATTSLSLPLSLSVQLTLYNSNNMLQHNTTTQKVCALSHIYAYMTFRHIYICVLTNRSGPISTGSGIDRFTVSSIRRDMFSQQTPPSLRHGMSLHSDLLPPRSQLVRCQHLGQHV